MINHVCEPRSQTILNYIFPIVLAILNDTTTPDMPPTTSSMQDIQPTTETDKHTTGDQDVQCPNPTPSIPMEYTSKLFKFPILCYRFSKVINKSMGKK